MPRQSLSMASAPAAKDLPPASEIEDYGMMVIAELDRAERDVESGEHQPFSGMSAAVMDDIAQLRTRQFDMFRRHMEIEATFKIRGVGSATASTSASGNDTFSGIASTMRKKETATAGLLNDLADFDAQLRSVMDKFERSPSTTSTTAEANQNATGSSSTGAASSSPTNNNKDDRPRSDDENVDEIEKRQPHQDERIRKSKLQQRQRRSGSTSDAPQADDSSESFNRRSRSSRRRWGN